MTSIEIKVASYNIRKAIGTDRTRRPIRILNVLEEIDADIVILQEADRRFGRRQSALPAFLIEAHSDYKPVPLDVQRDSMGWHGNAILVREDIEVRHHDIIHIPYLEPRGVITARLGVKGQALSVFGMHLDLSGLWRTKQANVIADRAREEQEHSPTILTGDLNEWRRNAGCLKVFGKHFSVLDCGRSFHSQRPLARLDRIMHCDRVEALEWGVHHSSLATQASDHLPVWARLRV
ncbi:endonuclease/exonuclease/phosphatase family protein [Erythrobacter sp.]|jgi:endonuclease/exonuclease/phosphatase family metal-dependent hydrolase|uniref:endonuclease/exonuclease/phosphatase family protein n=1 Tax=Erythrobacter sp. TaxID=1042 RepID=UPI002EAA79A9|nr:endonuclease/exonuclease/phosphatase family protein [Erythrobacter sp.]